MPTMAKRLIFSTAAPNDQGGIIPNDVIDFSRYNKNPVLLKEHCWGWDPLGILTDIQLINGQWTAVPVFHMETQASREAAGMYEKGALNAASIGGFAVWKTDKLTGDYMRDERGYRLCEKYYLYEVSLVALPSNPDAVGVNLHAKFYEEAEYANMENTLTNLSSKFNYKQMKKKPGEPGYDPKVDGPDAAEPDNNAAKPAGTATQAAGATEPVNELPPVIKQAIKEGYSVTFHSGAQPSTAGATAPAAKPGVTSEIPPKDGGTTNPDPIGLTAKQKAAAAKMAVRHRARADAEAAVKYAAECKAKADEDEADEMAATKYNSAKLAAEKKIKLAAEAEDDYEKAKAEADEEENTNRSGVNTNGTGQRQITLAGQGQQQQSAAPQLYSSDELAQRLTLAAAPTFKAKVKSMANGVTFTALNSSKADENSKKIMKRVFHTNRKSTDQVDLADHAVVLNSILNDPRLQAIVQKTRMIQAKAGEVPQMRNNYRGQRGASLQTLSADLAAGALQYWDRQSGLMKNLTLLTSTDNALAAPALNTIEWLSLAIFELFPTTSWKSMIPIFAAEMTARNTGTIWANIIADPTIYKGNQPAPANDYTYTDQAVSLALTPYYLQPMVWNPLYMHQLRYDQQATGWAQAFAKWNAVMDDNLIYTLASTVPASAIIPSSGLSGYQVNPQSFNIPNSGAQNKFYWSPNYAGQLLSPTLNDIIAIEQIYRNQNFELDREKAVLVIDPIMERYFSMDPETKSLLTRWVSSDSEEFLGFKHTILDVRSRVAVYDPTTGQVKDINGAIPATAQSAALGFLPSQVAMGLGMLDVFMVQDPSVYGYRMSADIRIGIAPLRYNFLGTSLYYYGLANV